MQKYKNYSSKQCYIEEEKIDLEDEPEEENFDYEEQLIYKL